MNCAPQKKSLVSAMICAQDGFYITALESILMKRLSLQQVFSVETLDQAIDLLAAAEDGVDLALFDLRTPGLDSRNAIQAIRSGFPETRVVLIAASHSRQDVLTSLDAGVHGFLNRDICVTGLVEALSHIGRGQIYVPPFLACVTPGFEPDIDTELPA
ncbi:response regulator [Alkalilacustris brevis]|uniref:response regulator n=1 Tax=Alkalilacustris brevis TaxID=2026338 RepID=UPI000E0D8321|nr:response regulator [Alkalilacustris brevis]